MGPLLTFLLSCQVHRRRQVRWALECLSSRPCCPLVAGPSRPALALHSFPGGPGALCTCTFVLSLPAHLVFPLGPPSCHSAALPPPSPPHSPCSSSSFLLAALRYATTALRFPHQHPRRPLSFPSPSSKTSDVTLVWVAARQPAGDKSRRTTLAQSHAADTQGIRLCGTTDASIHDPPRLIYTVVPFFRPRSANRRRYGTVHSLPHRIRRPPAHLLPTTQHRTHPTQTHDKSQRWSRNQHCFMP